jgi:hypothetical protein
LSDHSWRSSLAPKKADLMGGEAEEGHEALRTILEFLHAGDA